MRASLLPFVASVFGLLFVCNSAGAVPAGNVKSMLAKLGATPSADQIKSVGAAAVSAATSVPYAAVLNAASFGMTCAQNGSLGSDGNTVDTDGLLAAVASAQTYVYGAEIVLPPGLCIINRTIAIPVTASMRFHGSGIGTTTLLFYTPPTASTPTGNGLQFTVANGANLTVDDFTINRGFNSNNGTTFIGTAITIAAPGNHAGNVITSNLDIYPAFPNGQTDSWNIGLQETNISGPVISNVTITMPTWSYMPDPSQYMCSDGGTSFACAIHALPSPANPTATPSNLAYGQVATGVALGGSGPGVFQIDSVIEGLTVTGGMTGLDLQQFQGAYVTDSKFASIVYGIRADSPNTVSELLSVENSLFTVVTAGVYTNGIGAVQVTGNYIQPTNVTTTNLPSWTGIWSRNDNDVTITGNNVIGSGNAVAPEYGIYMSADSPNGYPVAITGNSIFALSSTGSVCLGNNANISDVTASGNTLTLCANYLADANGRNGYGNNSFQTPDILDDGHDNVQFTKGVTIGSFANPGSLTLYSGSQTSFTLGSNGQIATLGTFTTQQNVVANGSVSGNALVTSGPVIMTGSHSHNAASQVVGNFYFPNGTNPSTVLLVQQNGTPAPAPFPAVAPGLTTISGELTCTGNNNIISWHYNGHYLSDGKVVVLRSFSAVPEADPDSAAFQAKLTGNYTVTPKGNPNTPGLEIVFGPAVSTVFDCSAMLDEMVTD